MDDNVELSVAINIIDRKIAELTIKASDTPTDDIENELDKYLDLREEIYKGNISLIRKIINDNNE